MIISFHVSKNKERKIQSQLKLIQSRLDLRSRSMTIRFCIDKINSRLKSGAESENFIVLSLEEYDRRIFLKANELLDKAKEK